MTDMNTYILQIITLQNSTFNGVAYAIGTIILLINAGMTFDKYPDNSLKYVLLSLIWPFYIPVLMGIAVVSLPILLGRKIMKHTEPKSTTGGNVIWR